MYKRQGVLLGGAAAAAAGALGLIVGRHRGSARGPALPAMRPLTHRSGRVYAARFTHDGSRAVVCAAWDTEPLDVAVYELGTGESTSLELAGAHLAALSARGELALTRDHRFVDHQSARGELVVRSLSGGEPRPLADDVQEADFMPEPLAPRSPPPGTDPRPVRDGALAVVRPAGRGFRIELPLDRTLVEERGWITHLRAAPDGARLAYLRHPGTDDDAGALVVVDVATRAARVVTDGWASIAGLAWDQDGAHLWFTGSRDDLASTLHRVSLAGRVTAMPSATAGSASPICPGTRPRSKVSPVPSPPKPLWPQHFTWPSSSNAQTWTSPTPIATAVRPAPSAIAGSASPISPGLSPRATVLP